MRNQRTTTPGVRLAKGRTVRLPRDLDAELVRVAAERGVTVSALVSDLVTLATKLPVDAVRMAVESIERAHATG